MPLIFVPMPQATADHFRSGGPDAYGNLPERKISDGNGVPCRSCMRMVAKSEAYLLVAWQPFTARHAYAETGPVFLHAGRCAPEPCDGGLPEFLDSPDYILRGYDAGERIVGGTGGVISRDQILARAEALLGDPSVISVHVRSSRNNCYHCKIVPQEKNPPAS